MLNVILNLFQDQHDGNIIRVGMEKKVIPFAGKSSFAKELSTLVQTLSGNNASVLLIGERGTGKRLIAQHIHSAVVKSSGTENSTGYFFEINCRSFTEAQVIDGFETVSRMITYGQRITMFVSFADTLNHQMQAAFLDLIKKTAGKNLNLKIICTAERPIEDVVSCGEFSAELYSRLNTVILNVPPLRQRKEDIIPIAQVYLARFAKKSGLGFTEFSEGAKAEMLECFWQGNADELINAVQRAFIVGKPPVINESNLGFAVESPALSQTVEAVGKDGRDKSLKTAVDAFKREYIIRILSENGWNQTKAASVLGIQRTYVIRLMNELHIDRH